MNLQLPDEIIQEWPDVLDGLSITTIPVLYIDYINIEFRGGSSWELSGRSIRQADPHVISYQLNELLASYADAIENLELRLNIKKIKKDSAKVTNKLFNL